MTDYEKQGREQARELISAYLEHDGSDGSVLFIGDVRDAIVHDIEDDVDALIALIDTLASGYATALELWAMGSGRDVQSLWRLIAEGQTKEDGDG